jgi:hypothetical protein
VPAVTQTAYLVARKVGEAPPVQASFEEVKDRVVADYQISQRRALADSANIRLREALAGGADLESLFVRYGGLRAGKPFVRGGPIPEFARDATIGRDSLYLERVFTSKPGAVLPPLQGSSGTLYAMVHDISEPPAAEYLKRREELRREVLEQREEAWTERLRSRATVTIYRDDLRGLEH